MAEPNTTKKAVDLKGLQALKQVFPTRTEVANQISEAQLAGGSIEYATAEEVLALFQDSVGE